MNTLDARSIALLTKRGIAGHVAAERFVNDFLAYSVYFETRAYGTVDEMLDLLEDESNLTDSSILKTNWCKNISELISPRLRCNDLFMKLFEVLLMNKGKGVGVGELVLPLILSNYRFSNESDGIFYDNGEKNFVEIKNNGASLKPVKTGVTEKGLVDQLNEKYFNGNAPGYLGEKMFQKHVESVKDPELYRNYFQELYVGCDQDDLNDMVDEIKECYREKESFCRAVGKFALKQYQKVDGWTNILYIDADTMKIVNIADTTNIDELKLRFSPKLIRKKDTQAIADGYVNVRI